MITRKLNLFNILGDSESSFLFGPRGVGKTALVSSFLSEQPSYLKIDLLDRETYQQHLSTHGLFRSVVTTRLKQNSILTVFIDEVQKIPELLDDVHAILEEQFRSQTQQVRFILSGSSARKLKRGSANLLGGRAITLRVP